MPTVFSNTQRDKSHSNTTAQPDFLISKPQITDITVPELQKNG